MFNVNLYKFNKASISTARPVDAAIVKTCECVLLDSTSIINPRIALQFKDKSFTKPFDNNYAYIPEFNRYYFINNWEWSGGRWIASLYCDVLATYKYDIGASTQYVVRNSNTYDESVIDTYYPARCGCDVQTSVFQQKFTPVFSNGTYVVGVINSDSGSNGVGAVSYYIFTPAQFNVFRKKLLGDVSWFDGDALGDITAAVGKTIFNPFQYITSCNWFPFTITTATNLQVTKLLYGWWELDVACAKMHASGTYTISDSVSVPKHPQSSGKAFLNDAPFSQYRFDFAPVGCITIEPKYFYGVPNFGYICQVDLVTGKATVELRAHDSDLTINRCITVLNCVIGVPIQLAQVSLNAPSSEPWVLLGRSVLASASAIFGGDGLASVGNALEASFAEVQSTGSNGSASAYFLPPTLQAKFMRVVEDLPANMGRPLCKPKVISTLTGFTMCRNAKIHINGTQAEAESVVGYLNGGFIYE